MFNFVSLFSLFSKEVSLY